MKNNIDALEMLEKDLEQFQVKIESWKQLLNSWMEENILMKSILSDILKNNFDQKSLEEIEEFQTKFISEDELIHSLKRDINGLDKLLSMRIFEDWQMQKFFDSKTKNLENDIHSSTTRFRILKSAFHDFQYKISAKHENQEL
jgi:HD superfamily phosphohydrolase